MARAKRLNVAATGTVAVGDMEFIPPGIRVGIKGSDSVKTANMSAKVQGVSVFDGLLPIEPGTDQQYPWSNLLTTFVSTDRSQIIIEFTGTVTDTFLDYMWLDAAREPCPWG